MGRSRHKRHRSSSSSSESSVERYRKRSANKNVRECEPPVRSYTPGRKRSPSRSSGSRSSKSPDKSDSLGKAHEKILKLEALVEKLARKSDDGEKSSRVSVRSDCIPEFSPDKPNLTASKWLEKVDQLKEINGWDDVATIYHMQSRLVGNAKTWYHSLTDYNHTWEEWKRLIIKSFPDHSDYATLLHTMLSRTKQPDETMTTYYFEKMELLRGCEIIGKNAVSCLIAGLPEKNIQNAARAGRHDTPESLYEEFLSAVQVGSPSTSKQESKHIRPAVSSKVVDLKNNWREKPSKSRSSHIKCFNCGTRGHIASKCVKAKVECKHCHLLGHDVTNCWRRNKEGGSKKELESKCMLNCSFSGSSGSSIIVKSTDAISKRSNQELNACYFIDCSVNNNLLRGYVDSGSGAVTIRDTEATRLNLARKPTQIMLRGYGGGVVFAKSQVDIDLRVDMARNYVSALVVPDDTQQVPIIIGQPFINNDNVVMVVRGGQVRLFHKNDLEFSAFNTLPSRKVTLCARETMVIPPHHIGHVSVYGDLLDGDVFIDLQNRTWPSKFHVIPRCVISLGEENVLPVFNNSDQPVEYLKNVVVARGFTCIAEDPNLPFNMLTTSSISLPQLTLAEIRANEKLSQVEKERLLETLNRYRGCFARDLSQLGKSSSTKMSIKLTDDIPITYRPYRLPYSEREKVREIVQDLLDNDVIQESHSPYASPILLVRKKNGETRLCVDYRALNRKTLKDKYPLPRIDDLLDRLKGCQYFSSLDLASGYHQIPLDEESVPKTAFITPDGHYEYLRMPFGLVNAPAVFQRTMNEILGSFRFSTALAYLDDILIPSSDVENGLKALELVLGLIEQSGMTLRLNKCSFLQTSIAYLGHEISGEGIKPGAEKILAVTDFPTPKNVHEVRQFLGLSSYFRKFIYNFATIAKPLSNLTKKNASFVWSDTEKRSFDDLKQKLTTRPLLAIYDREAVTELHTDASKVGVGGILLQVQSNGELKPVQYYSRSTTKEEQNYHSYELETLAVVNSLKKFRVYLIGITFKIVTDCNALRSTLTKRDLIPRIGRWWLATQEYDFSIEYRAGSKMSHVDALSRNPVPSSSDVYEIPILHVNINEDDWVLSAQLTDKRCRELHKVLTEVPITPEDKKVHKEFLLKENRLYRVTTKGKRWVVPKAARRNILNYYHDGAGHFGVDKTMEAIEKRYWFPAMRAYIRNYIACCLGCLYNKKPAGKSPGSLHSIEKKDIPMDTLHLDHLGPFVKSKKKNCYLIVAVDGFTKFVFMKAIPSTSTTPVIRFLDEIIELFGVPRRFITDRGTAFTSNVFKSYCSNLNIKHVLCATATPRANGQVERMNRVILDALTSSVDDEERWDQEISKVRWGINSTVSSTTGKSPYEVFLGYRPRGVNDAYLSAEVCEDDPMDLGVLRGQVSERIAEQQLVQKRAYDNRHALPRIYEVGQQVLVKRAKSSNEGKSKKLEPRFKGPYVITKVLDHDRYVVEDMPGAKRSRVAYKGICPSDKMKPYQVTVSSESSDEDEKGLLED